jgi:F-box/leucine-rich repeat protein 6
MLGLNDVPVREQVMAPGFPMLEELTIGVDQRGYFDGMDDQQIERILKKSSKLRLLDIRGCKGISDSTLVRLPCWDIEYLYVAGCSVTSSSRDGLELLVKKWCRTLIEIDIGLTSDQKTVDWAVIALVENEEDLKLRKLNLTGTAVSLKPLTKLLNCCPTLASLNLTSCRALPRGMKRMYHSRDDVQGLMKDIGDGKFDARDAGSDDD